MSKTMQSAVICALLAAKEWIFEDEETMKDIYGLGQQMFDVPNEHLTENQRQSLRVMIEAVEGKKTLKERYEIVQGKQQTGFGAGRDALKKWFKDQKVSKTIADRIDKAFEDAEVLPLQLIHSYGASKDEFPEIGDCESGREDAVLAIFGSNALCGPLKGNFREATGTIMHHAWERHRKRYARAKKTLALKRLTSTAAVKGVLKILDSPIVLIMCCRDRIGRCCHSKNVT
jgi:hypothetical protein